MSADCAQQQHPRCTGGATGLSHAQGAVPGRLGHAHHAQACPDGAGLRATLAGCCEGRREREMASPVLGSLWPWATALLLALGAERALALPEICTQCPGSVQNLSQVAVYCKQTSGLTLQARCCLNQKGTILGLDLQNCSLKNPGPNFAQAHTAAIIDLQANPLKDNLTSTFHGFTQLQTLVLPQDVICPGGINAWLSIISYVDIQICQGQKDLCNSTGNPEMCPENGSCASAGPGLLQCVCADGFQGYKCMRQGSFPLLMFFGILGSTTLSISALLWGTQRRKAKTS
ncbi:all-trans retinoic acid-induced differentiation factor isoform X1 [Perognathus longimembris pacificus]|uniref:all-trans retinoic acid-induced differentiation factor isoform X1 n=1 Tax=Perognathus longimembris pacificus TaxID=214514 RepID=UPI002019CD76|nr:all-trans retinoic acid-induced differentiation factor isoform X1 [Perognathus longimembris pacificus]